jgi:two-component sensor histidine kinase
MLAAVQHPSVPADEPACVEHFKTIIAQTPIYRELALIGRDGKFHCSTVPIPPDLDVKDRFYFTEPLRTGRFAVGKVTTGRVTGQRSIHLTMPYKAANGTFDGIIALILNPNQLANTLTGLEPADRLVVTDREGTAVISLPPQEMDVADRVAAEVFKTAQGRMGTTTVNIPGIPEQIAGYVSVNSPPEGLFVAVATDRESSLAGVRRLALRNVVLALLVIVLAIAAAWLVGQLLISRPVSQMIGTARRREAGDTSAQFPVLAQSSELGQLSSALASMSTRLTELVAQKEFLLRELHHRVMNSLNILTSMMTLQSKHATSREAKEQLARAQSRILSMASVYKYLYRIESAGEVDLASFLDSVCSEAAAAYTAGAASLHLDVDPMRVPVQVASSVALLLHELITNTIKHAYPAERAGPIYVSCKRVSPDFAELRYSDRGVGLSPEILSGQSDSLGMRLIKATARQLGGEMTITPLDPGTEFSTPIRVRNGA